ncbi:MAG: hypothetical protein IJA95_03900 [Bacteroidaceae bacterium]|nr:hypothetical protein [Bacteroides sp.]MBQ4588407.1 hypothetical protein [Bacteroidaceae bacterium]
MSEKKYSFRNEIKYENQKAREEQAKKDFKRNMYGLNFSAIVFFFVLLVTLNGIVVNQNLMMLLLVASMMGVFYFGRELRVLPKGQIIFSSVKALLCLGMAASYIVMHQGYWDWMDYGILGILLGVVLIDIPRVLKAKKELKS